MSEGRIPAALLGAGGYIGQHFARLLAAHPRFEPVLLTSGTRSAGKRLEEVWQLESPPPEGVGRQRIYPTSNSRIVRSGIRVAFIALPSGTSGPIESELARRDIAVFSNAADHRMDAGVPLLVPEVNSEHLRVLGRAQRRGLLVTNPNCSTTGLVMALAPIWQLLRPRAVHVSTYQSLSGAGCPGVPSLAVTDNVLPYIAEEEEKIGRESPRILGSIRSGRVVPVPVPFLAHTVRVAVREGHLEAVTVEARAQPGLQTILDALRRFDPLASLSLSLAPHPAIQVRSENDRPQPLRDRWAGTPAIARGMAAVVGRVRWNPPYLRFLVLTHNAVRGGAGGSILNAELADVFGLLRTRGGR